MKIAILLSGRLTSYDKHYQNIMHNLVQDNEVDFYAALSEEPINKRLIDGFLKLYNPVAWKYSDKPLLDIEWDKVKANGQMSQMKKNPMFMWRNREEVKNLLIESKVEYDWIISTRVDVMYKAKLDYNILESDKLSIPTQADYSGYQDKIVIAKQPLILEYLDLYDNMKRYLIDDKRSVNPETLLKYHIDKGKNIPVHRISLEHYIRPKIATAKKCELAETGQL